MNAEAESERLTAEGWRNLGRRGVTSLEYALVAAGVVVIGLAGFGPIGSYVKDNFQTLMNAMT